MAITVVQLRERLESAGVDVSLLEGLITSSGESLYVLSTHGSHAIQLWRRLRELTSQTTHWPVLIGQDDDLVALRVQVCDREFGTTSEILDSGTAISAAEWFERKHEELIDELLEFGGPLYFPSAEESLGSREEFRGIVRGPWPIESKPSHDFTMPLDLLSREPLPRVYVALVPTTVSWHVPAYLRVGSWNECPSPAEHMALMNAWSQRFGAEVVGISRDVVEMLVERPPSNKVDAMRLAKEQYLYCQDIVDQGTRTLEALAAFLLNGRSWYFWWD
jgi:hypothetical protein